MEIVPKLSSNTHLICLNLRLMFEFQQRNFGEVRSYNSEFIKQFSF